MRDPVGTVGSRQGPPSRRGAAVLVLSLLLLAPAPLASAAGGGSVVNKLPTVETFSNTGASMNDGSTDTFAGTVKDRNGEADIVSVKVFTTIGPIVSSLRTVVAADVAATTEPASYDGAGWKVWNPAANDGFLSFKYQYTYPSLTEGTYVWRGAVKDEGAEQTGPAADITVTVIARVTAAADPVLSTGSASTGAAWGAWAADPGGLNVQGVNFIKITNSGTTAAQSFTVDFTATSFAGVTNPNQTISIDANIQFAWWEDTTPATTAPSEGTFTYGASSATGSVTAAFTATTNIIYVKYQLVSVPATLLDQSYQASYTVTAV